MNRPEAFTHRVTLRHLRVVHVVGQELNLSRAARRLNTSQPAVSAALRELESLLDARLFERTTRKVALSALGLALWRHAERILGEVDRAALDFEATRSGMVGRLHIGLIPQVPASLLAYALRSLQEAGETVRVHVHEGSAQVLAQQLALGHLDALISHLSTGVIAAPLHIDELYEDTTCLVVASGHALARRQRLKWEDVRKQRWILPPTEAPVRARIEREMLVRGPPELGSAIDASSQATVLALLEQTGAVAVLNRRVAQQQAARGLVKVLPLPFEVGIARFALLRRRLKNPPTVLQCFAAALRQAAGP